MKRAKLLPLVLILIFSLFLVGCSGSESASAVTSEQGTEESTNTENTENNTVADSAKAYFANMPADIYKIPQQDFVDKVKANEDIFIMDIRQPDVYAEGHTKGAVNIPWGQDIAQNLASLPKDKPIMVYCYTGQTAGQTVALLNVAGFNAKSVNLGWNRGISKVAGVDDVTETTANAIPEANTQINEDIQLAINDYFSKMALLKGTSYANYKISEDDAKKLLDAKDPSAVFLSIRKAGDYDKGHIEGAINLPFTKGMQAYFDMLVPKDRKIIVYCYTGQTAGQTVAILRLLGFDAVSLNSGMGMPATGATGWANKGFPLSEGASQAVEPSAGDFS